ncbi:MAG: YfiR family protein, partial [Rhizobacter sp.]
AYLYRLLSYVDWPPAVLEGGGPFGIGVVQADDILEELQRVLPGRTVHGRPVLARRLAEGDALDGRHVVLVGGSSRRAASWMRVLRDRRMLLTVTDAAGGLATGSILNFVETDGKVRFEASLVAAEKAELKLSSRLLAVAVRVETKE